MIDMMNDKNICWRHIANPLDIDRSAPACHPDERTNARPAAQRAEALKTKFTFKTEVDEDARKMLFPSNERLKNV